MPEPNWMQPPTIRISKNHQQASLNKPYLSWPLHLELEGFEVSVRRDPGKGCQVVKYIFDVQNRQWVYEKATAVLEVLKDMIVGPEDGPSYFLKKCLKEDLGTAKQLRYLEDLYNLLPLWSQVRRQLEGTKNLVAQVSRHEISSFTTGERDDRYYIKRLSVVEDQLRRCTDAADKTKNLINLVMNIASLQESRAAVQESRSANATAASIKRVTILTFIYLPLTLASSIMGMNITQITGEGTHSQLWLYPTIAVALMAATFGGWVVSDEKVSKWLCDNLSKTTAADRQDDPEAHRLNKSQSP
ncbi:hypothetical protein N0V91_000658 [Didymella pomorum]|uniref:Metal ion transmembrane transporter n=1 Tax=Didymella pomorum TaxID=749634 RepID=A0A9W9DCK1_9PLEO|nr:hypothetical protein N0V91_000658 [Didymella pomorum]